MKENRSSITAEGIAIMRGIESLKPPGERICYDPYARQFANPLLWYLAKFLVDTGYTEMTGPGVGAFIVARERYYVPIDFTTETLEKRLYECGYDQQLKTLFIWQGVTLYLTPEAVDGTLAFAANHSGQGSTIIFDYIYTWLLGAADQRGEIKRMRRSRRFTGEGLTFGIVAAFS